MAVSYNWSFPALDITYSEDGFSDVVNVVHWVCVASDGPFSASAYGTVGLPAPGTPFTSFDALTPEMVLGWTEGALGDKYVTEMKANLAAQIESEKAPKGGTVPPPWQAPAS